MKIPAKGLVLSLACTSLVTASLSTSCAPLQYPFRVLLWHEPSPLGRAPSPCPFLLSDSQPAALSDASITPITHVIHPCIRLISCLSTHTHLIFRSPIHPHTPNLLHAPISLPIHVDTIFHHHTHAYPRSYTVSSSLFSPPSLPKVLTG
jgi:hypothetical protein